MIFLSLEELYLVQDKGLLSKMPSIDFLQVFVSGDNPIIQLDFGCFGDGMAQGYRCFVLFYELL